MALGDVELAKAARLKAEGRFPEAERAYRRLAKQFPRLVDAHYCLGTFLAETGRFEESIESLRHAATLAPESPYIRINLGAALRRAGKTAEAVDLLRAVVADHPGLYEGWVNLGTVQRDLGDLGAAVGSYRQALQIRPDSPQAHWNLAAAFQEQGRWEESAKGSRQALSLDPGLTQANLGLALYHLASGNWQEGWPLYETRWIASDRVAHGQVRPATSLPQWRGERVDENSRLLVFAEQGLGDSIQFCRYLDQAAGRFARVGFVCPPALMRLLGSGHLSNVELLPAAPEDESAWDWHCPLLSLPLAFGTTVGTVPPPSALISIDPTEIARWRDRLDAQAGGGRRVGVVRAGNPGLKYALSRDIDPGTFAGLFSVPDIAWVNLQKGAEMAPANGGPGTRMVDWMDEISDFHDTAALISALDLVISVDTAVAHLAGQLGKPVWLLSWGEWRWLRDRDDSPWYPSMRIFRKGAGGGWSPTIAEVSQALVAWRAAAD